MVGISLDGPELIHDAHRLTGSGKGSYDLVMRGIRHLQNEGVEYFPYIQFIPCMDFVSQKSDMSGRFRITPEQYGTFLCRTFDLWYNEGYPELPIRIFENMLLVFMHREAELCVHNSCCPKMMVLETNGDARATGIGLMLRIGLRLIISATATKCSTHTPMNACCYYRTDLNRSRCWSTGKVQNHFQVEMIRVSAEAGKNSKIAVSHYRSDSKRLSQQSCKWLWDGLILLENHVISHHYSCTGHHSFFF